jgi:tRNA threonylcarbamoyl adenosine modification protein YeaZ
MKILAFDTSNNTASVAISEGQTILAYLEELKSSMQAELLLIMIENALSYSGLSYNDIDYLGVTNGPGSFTGIRIGLAAAEGISLGAKIKAYSVTNFAMAHFRATKQVQNYDKIIILLNAYRNQLYLQVFDKNGNAGTAELIDNNLVIELLNKERGKVVCAGSGVELIYHQIKSLTNITILPRFARIKALHICRYIDNKISSGYLLSPIEPLYIRPADAKLESVQ